MLAERFSTTGTLTKCKLQTKIKYVKNLEHVQFFVGRGQVDFGKEQPLCPGNCNCFILVFIMNMHPLLLLDNSQSKGSIRVLQQFGYRQFCCCRFLEVFEIVVLIVHKKLVLE